MFTTFLMIILCTTSGVSLGETKGKLSGNFKGEKIRLFNGKDLNNWTFFLKNPSVNPATVFTVGKGVIHMFSNPWGYMRTKDSYSNYKLHVEWRWPVVATNSGVFIHYQPRDSNTFRWLECNLVAGGAGDFICEKGVDMDERIDKTKGSVKKLATSSEKVVGKWNTMEIVCIGNNLEVFVNKVLQNRATNMTVHEGSICLQCEGSEIEFRNVYLTKLKK